MSEEAPAVAPAAAAAPAPPAKKGRKPKEPKEPGSAKKKQTKPSHPPTLEMITKAISVEKNPKGVSVMAIKKYILDQYKVQPIMLRHMLKRAFDAGLAAGKLTRPKGQSESHLLSGRYRLAGKEKHTTAVTVKPKKAAAKPASKAKKTPAVKKPAAKPSVKKSATPAAAKKAKSPKKAKKTPAKPAAKKPAAKKATKKAAKKA